MSGRPNPVRAPARGLPDLGHAGTDLLECGAGQARADLGEPVLLFFLHVVFDGPPTHGLIPPEVFAGIHALVPNPLNCLDSTRC